MEANVRGLHPPRVLDVGAARGKRERPRRGPSGKEFELEEGEPQPSRPAVDTPNTEHGTVSSRREGEVGARLDLTA